ncbi:hypothetical protein X975_13085, partial [Stegodyphus mimosarum]
MISLVNQDTNMESNPPKLLNNNQEAAELLGLSSSDSLDSPSFTHFQAPKQKRKVRFKKPFRPSSRAKAGRNGSGAKSCNCSFVQGAKIFSYFLIVAVVGALLWYVMSLSTRVQELQDKFADCKFLKYKTSLCINICNILNYFLSYINTHLPLPLQKKKKLFF